MIRYNLTICSCCFIVYAFVMLQLLTCLMGLFLKHIVHSTAVNSWLSHQYLSTFTSFLYFCGFHFFSFSFPIFHFATYTYIYLFMQFRKLQHLSGSGLHWNPCLQHIHICICIFCQTALNLSWFLHSSDIVSKMDTICLLPLTRFRSLHTLLSASF